ncbi:hypothetical protein ACFTAO_33065 [Paenibacillus rhizoplanae]
MAIRIFVVVSGRQLALGPVKPLAAGIVGSRLAPAVPAPVTE